jgi:hypothetical protein
MFKGGFRAGRVWIPTIAQRPLFTAETQFGPKDWIMCFPFDKKYFVKKKYGNLVALTFYSSPITYLFSLNLILDFLFSFIFFYFVYLFISSFFVPQKSWMKERRKILVAWLCIGVFYVNSTSVKHSNLVLRYEMEKYALFVVMCEFMCKKKLII